MIKKVIKWLNEHHLPVRVLVAVIAGIATSMILSVLTHAALSGFGVFPPMKKPLFDDTLVTIELIYHSIYAITGAVVTAKVAENKANEAVFILGTKEAIMWLLGILLLWHHSPPWYNLTKAILGVPLAIFGGYVYKKVFKKEAKAPVKRKPGKAKT